MTPLISVIVPIYNVEKYLVKCIESIQNQTYSNLEIILVNDGSPDNSKSICEKYAEIDKRIVVANKENGGLSSARNYGMNIAKGEYFTFVDSDDTVDSNFIENLYFLVSQYNTKISITLFKHIKEGDRIEQENIIDSQKIDQREALKKMFYQDLFDNNATSKLYHHSLFKEIRFPKGLLYEDLLTTYRVMLLAEEGVAFSSVQNYHYLLRDDSIEGSSFNKKKFESLTYIINDLESQKLKTPYLEKSINCRLASLLFHLLFETEQNSKFEKEIFSLVKKYRVIVIKDKYARKKARIASMISFFGIRALRFFYTFGKSRK